MAEMNFKAYQAFRGVDYSASPAAISDDHASDMLNMYVGEDGVMQKRPGWRVLKDFGDRINGIHYLRFRETYGYLFVHVGNKLYMADFRKEWRNFQYPSVGDVAILDVDTTEHPEFSFTASAAAFINRYVAGIVTDADLERWQVKNMDLNGDGVVSTEDAIAVLRYVVGLESMPDGKYGALSTSWTRVKKPNGSAFTLNNRRSLMFDHDDKLYIIDGGEYYVVAPKYGEERESTDEDGRTFYYKAIEGFEASVVEGYIPNTGVAGFYKYDDLNEEGTNTPGSQENPGVWQKPQLNEKRNLLQKREINTFIADGIHKAYYLRENNNSNLKVEMLIWTRCKSVNGVDVPTQENIEHVDAGTYNGIYYYYRYIWTNIPSDHATYGWSARNANSQTPQQNEISYSTRIAFDNAPPAHKENIENIRVTFTSNKHASTWAVTKDRGYIRGCTIATKYGYFNDNRIFLAGNPEHQNMDFASAVDDPTYFPDDGWTLVGSRQTSIMGYLHYGTDLAIIKEDNELDATVYMRSAQLTEGNDVIFPVRQGTEGFGAISKRSICSLRDDPLFLAKEGVYAVEGTDASQERNIPNRSFYIDPAIRKEITDESVAAAWVNYWLLCMPSTGKCYVADSRSIDSHDGSFVYNWYVWNNIPATMFCVIGNKCYFGTTDGKLCVFNSDWNGMDKYSDGATLNESIMQYENGEAIRAFYTTKRDHLGAVDYKKTILNDGGVITLVPYELSSAQISVKTEKGEWFIDDIQTDSDEPSVVIPIRKRMKNFDSIQTTVENDRLNEGLAILNIQYRYAITTNRRQA